MCFLGWMVCLIKLLVSYTVSLSFFFFFLSFLMIGFFLVRDGKKNVQSYVFTVISWQLFLIKTDKKLQMLVNHQFKIDHPVLDESLQIATCVYILYMFGC